MSRYWGSSNEDMQMGGLAFPQRLSYTKMQMERWGKKLRPAYRHPCKCRTVDGMQGYEDDIVILDFVRDFGIAFTFFIRENCCNEAPSCHQKLSSPSRRLVIETFSSSMILLVIQLVTLRKEAS